MFKQTFLGDYLWELNSQISIQFVNNEYVDITEGFPVTNIFVDNVSYPLKGDYREQFEATGGDLRKIKQVYLQYIEHTPYNIPKGESYAPMMKVFIEHIDKHIK
jgi:hypothetical protein